ncbi:MAG: hypothetical protein WDW36_009731 [Sanguina aurantia]
MHRSEMQLLLQMGIQLPTVLPHVNDCSLCMDCTLDGPAPPPTPYSDIRQEHFQPEDVLAKQRKPFCQRCRGCSTSLQILARSGSKQLFNTTFRDETGASPSWLFVTPTDKTPNGKAVIKVACIPVGKTASEKFPRCQAELAAEDARVYYAVERIAEECGLMDVIPKVWVERVNGVIPGIGYHVRWLAVWMEQAGGISLENIVRLGDPMMHPNDLLAILHTSLNKTQVVRAAIFDLLTTQSDRHAQNIFIQEDGTLKLIDNERSLHSDRFHAADSLLLPTTKKYMINVIENAWVSKFKNWPSGKVPQCWANVALLFDYRCYVPDGRIGKAWPADVGTCLAKFRTMSTEELRTAYHFPSEHTALAFKNRTTAMVDHGFEWALSEGYPRNPDAWRYRPTPPLLSHQAHRHLPLDPGRYTGGSVS